MVCFVCLFVPSLFFGIWQRMFGAMIDELFVNKEKKFCGLQTLKLLGEEHIDFLLFP